MAKSIGWTAVALLACIAAAPSPLDAATQARPRPPLHDAVVLAGEIHAGGAAASGQLALYLDGKLQATVPSATGDFEIAMPGRGDARMVSLEFSAPGLRLRSLLGGQARLVRAAGADGRLGAESEDALRLSPLGSALSVLAGQAVGAAPASDAALADAVGAIPGMALVVATTALARLAEDPALLPPGFDDGMALLEDEAAYLDYVLDTNPGIVDAPEDVLDAIPATPLAARDTGPVLAFTGARQAVGVPPHGPGVVVEREGDGYRVHDFLFDGPSYAGAIDAGGALALVPHASVAWVNQYGPSCPSTGASTTWEVWTLLRRDLRRHWRGSGTSLWQLGRDYELSYPDCPDLAPVAARSVELSAAPDMAHARMLTTPRRFLGRQALPLFCPLMYPHGELALEPCGQADHVFARDGSGFAQPPDGPVLAFAWSLDAHGAMRLDYGDSATRVWIFDAGDRVQQGVVYVAEGSVSGEPGTSGGHATLVRGGVD